MSDVTPTDAGRRRPRGSVTLLAGLGVLVAAVVMVALALRVDESDAGSGGLVDGKLTVGLQDDRLVTAPVGEIPARLNRLKVSGARFTRIEVAWAQIAPSKPADPGDPDDSAYQWGRTDAIIDGLDDRGIAVVVSFCQTPGWSNGNRTPEWFGSPDDYAAFVRAFATRYSGDDHGAVLIYEPWSEPNNAAMLMPQWQGAGSTATPVSPATYATIYERARTEIRRAAPDALVAGLGLADIETSTGGVGGVGVRDFVGALASSAPEMTLVSQHLTPIDPPGATTTRVPSIGAMDDYLALVDRIAPGADVLISAVGYATQPGGLSEAAQAEAVGATVAALARHPRVRLAIWYSMQDTLERPSGLVRVDGSEKPAWQAYLNAPKLPTSGTTP